MEPELVEPHIEEPLARARDDPAAFEPLREPIPDLAAVGQRVDVQTDATRKLAVDEDPVPLDAHRVVEAALDERARIVGALGRVLPDHPRPEMVAVRVDQVVQRLCIIERVRADDRAAVEVPVELVHGAAVAVSRLDRSSSCRIRRSTLPTSVSGNVSRNSTSFGAR